MRFRKSSRMVLYASSKQDPSYDPENRKFAFCRNVWCLHTNHQITLNRAENTDVVVLQKLRVRLVIQRNRSPIQVVSTNEYDSCILDERVEWRSQKVIYRATSSFSCSFIDSQGLTTVHTILSSCAVLMRWSRQKSISRIKVLGVKGYGLQKRILRRLCGFQVERKLERRSADLMRPSEMVGAKLFTRRSNG